MTAKRDPRTFTAEELKRRGELVTVPRGSIEDQQHAIKEAKRQLWAHIWPDILELARGGKPYDFAAKIRAIERLEVINAALRSKEQRDA